MQERFIGIVKAFNPVWLVRQMFPDLEVQEHKGRKIDFGLYKAGRKFHLYSRGKKMGRWKVYKRVVLDKAKVRVFLAKYDRALLERVDALFRR